MDQLNLGKVLLIVRIIANLFWVFHYSSIISHIVLDRLGVMISWIERHVRLILQTELVFDLIGKFFKVIDHFIEICFLIFVAIKA